MKAAYIVLVVGIAAVCLRADPSAQRSDVVPSGETAVLSWAAFECAVYAGMSGKPTKENERLFQLGYERGKQFLEAARRGAISADEEKKVPIGMRMLAGGPTADFVLGRIYQSIEEEAYGNIVKEDSSGVPLPVDKWLTDPELRKGRAENEYRRQNCALLK